MTTMYDISFDEEAGLLEIRLTGFWTTEIVHAFHRDYLAAVDRYSPRFPQFPTVSDSRGFAVMSTEANEAFLKGARETAQRHTGRIAVVFQSQIAKLQAERTARILNEGVAQPRPQRFFTEVSEARSWALNEDVLDGRI